MRTPCPSVGQTPIATIDRRLNTQAEFNARLIAAAPSMAEALRAVLKKIERKALCDWEPSEIVAIECQIRAALALVEGKE